MIITWISNEIIMYYFIESPKKIIGKNKNIFTFIYSITSAFGTWILYTYVYLLFVNIYTEEHRE